MLLSEENLSGGVAHESDLKLGRLGPGGSIIDDHRCRYVLDKFVARYAAAWAYGVVGSQPPLSGPYYQVVHRHDADVLLQGGRTVLDVGCGPGRILSDLAGRFPDVDFVGVDRSEVMSDLARRILCGPPTAGVELDASDFGFEPVRLPGFGLTNVTVRAASLEDVSATARRYDLVIASHLLDRVDDPAAALDRLMHLVAARGRLLIASAFNYEHRRQWEALPSAAAVVERVCDAGWRIEVLDHDVAYREQLDARGTVTQHRVLLLRIQRPVSGPEPGVVDDE